MAKRGRPAKEKKGYFYETEEQAIVQYIHETNEIERNKLFNNILYPALTKMIESIIRRYKLFVPDEDFDQNFNDTISYLLTKIDHFKPEITGYDEMDDWEEIKKHSSQFEEFSIEKLREKIRNATDDDPDYVKVYYKPELEDMDIPTRFFKKETHHYKAYSYCGTVCKNYLMYKSSQYAKRLQRNAPYDDVYEEISNNPKYSTQDKGYSEIAEKLIIDVTNEIERMINNAEENLLDENEVKVGQALVNLFRNWEEVLPDNGSNKLQKSSVLYFLREETMMTTKEVRDNMKKFKCIFNLLKKMAME